MTCRTSLGKPNLLFLTWQKEEVNFNVSESNNHNDNDNDNKYKGSRNRNRNRNHSHNNDNNDNGTSSKPTRLRRKQGKPQTYPTLTLKHSKRRRANLPDLDANKDSKPNTETTVSLPRCVAGCAKPNNKFRDAEPASIISELLKT